MSRPEAVDDAGCHCTPTAYQSSRSHSIASTTPSSARALTRKPLATRCTARRVVRPGDHHAMNALEDLVPRFAVGLRQPHRLRLSPGDAGRNASIPQPAAVALALLRAVGTGNANSDRDSIL